NGRLTVDVQNILERGIKDSERMSLLKDIVGIQNIPKRAALSLAAQGSELVGRPQLASTVTLAGGVASYLSRRIILGKYLPSGRWYVWIQQALGLEDDTDSPLSD